MWETGWDTPCSGPHVMLAEGSRCRVGLPQGQGRQEEESSEPVILETWGGEEKGVEKETGFPVHLQSTNEEFLFVC